MAGTIARFKGILDRRNIEVAKLVGENKDLEEKLARADSEIENHHEAKKWRRRYDDVHSAWNTALEERREMEKENKRLKEELEERREHSFFNGGEGGELATAEE